MKLKLSLLCVVMVALFSGCASGPSLSSSSSLIPPLNPEKGRIFFYRTSALGAAIQPAVKVNGVEIGKAKPHGVYFYDAAPGEYKIETSTEVTRNLSIKLEQGETRYVRLNISMGFMVGHVYPELVDPKVGAEEAGKCSLIQVGK